MLEDIGNEYQEHWVESQDEIKEYSVVCVEALTYTKWWNDVTSKVQVPYAREGAC